MSAVAATTPDYAQTPPVVASSSKQNWKVLGHEESKFAGSIAPTQRSVPQAIPMKSWMLPRNSTELNVLGKAVQRQIQRLLIFFKVQNYGTDNGEEVLESLTSLLTYPPERFAEGTARLLKESMLGDFEQTMKPLLQDKVFRTLLGSQCRMPDFERVWKETLLCLAPDDIALFVRNLPPEAGHLQRDIVLAEKEQFPEQYEEQHQKLQIITQITAEDQEKWSIFQANPEAVFQDPTLWNVLKKVLMHANQEMDPTSYAEEFSQILQQALPKRELFIRWIEKLSLNPYTKRFANEFLSQQIAKEFLQAEMPRLEFLFEQFGDQATYVKERLCIQGIKEVRYRAAINSLRRLIKWKEVTLEVLRIADIEIREGIDMPSYPMDVELGEDEDCEELLEATLAAKIALSQVLERVHAFIKKSSSNPF